MAPRAAVRRERDNDFSAVGKIGRRTGITLAPRPIDENGIEEISGMFSSPRKPSPLRKSFHARDIEGESSTSGHSAEMIGMDSTGLTPSQALWTRKSLRGTPLPPPRSASPKKSGINGTARRSDALSMAKDLPPSDPEDRENSPALSPSRALQPTLRRFSPSPEKSPLRDITPATRKSSQASTKGKGQRKARVGSYDTSTNPGAEAPSESNSNADDLYQEAVREIEDVANSTAQFDDSVQFPADGDDDQEWQHDDEPQNVEEIQLPEQIYDHEDADQTIEPSDLPAEEPGPAKANSRRKRKSDAMDREAPNAFPSSPAAKKARKIAETNAKAAPEPTTSSTAVPSQTSSKAPKAKPIRERGRPAGKARAPEAATQFSTQREAELEQIVEKVKARPGQSKSLYILRRETPADEAVTHTRSGRVSVKPLAYWRNERCVFGGSPGGSSLQDGARFPMNSIKEIIRTDEVEAEMSKQRKAGRRGRKGKSKSRAPESDSEQEGDQDPNAEPWESAVGIFRGPVSVWDPQQQAPLEEEEEMDLAYAPASIQAREVPGSTFQYAKLLSTKFFGSGIVDLPPGGVKRPKNSRKMHMSFFVATGRVTVQMGPLGGEESRFSVGKGGFWQVPRGNQYSIENELKKPARIFFSQGCEVAASGDD